MLLSSFKLMAIGSLCVLGWELLHWFKHLSKPHTSLDWLHDAATRQPASLTYDAKLQVWVLTLPNGKQVMSNSIQNVESYCDEWEGVPHV